MVETSQGALPPQTHTLFFDERTARGRALRERCSRKRHATWEAPSHRRDPVEILIEQGEARLPDLLPLRDSLLREIAAGSGTRRFPAHTVLIDRKSVV